VVLLQEEANVGGKDSEPQQESPDPELPGGKRQQYLAGCSCRSTSWRYSTVKGMKGEVCWDVWLRGSCQLRVWTVTEQSAVLHRKVMEPGCAS